MEVMRRSQDRLTVTDEKGTLHEYFLATGHTARGRLFDPRHAVQTLNATGYFIVHHTFVGALGGVPDTEEIVGAMDMSRAHAVQQLSDIYRLWTEKQSTKDDTQNTVFEVVARMLRSMLKEEA